MKIGRRCTQHILCNTHPPPHSSGFIFFSAGTPAISGCWGAYLLEWTATFTPHRYSYTLFPPYPYSYPYLREPRAPWVISRLNDAQFSRARLNSPALGDNIKRIIIYLYLGYETCLCTGYSAHHKNSTKNSMTCVRVLCTALRHQFLMTRNFLSRANIILLDVGATSHRGCVSKKNIKNKIKCKMKLKAEEKYQSFEFIR